MAKKSEIFGFCLFDFANSAYTTVIITAVYSVYFVQHIGSPFLWSLTLCASYGLVLLMGPLAGAAADFAASRKRFLLFSFSLCVAATALLYFGTPERRWLAVALVILSNLGFSLSEGFVSSFLPGLSTRASIGRISGYAWAFGYVGGVASLVLSLLYLKSAGFSGETIRTLCLFIAGFFALFGLPVFFLLREKEVARPRPAGSALFSAAFGRLRATFREIRNYAMLFRFLTAFFVFSCGIATVISFAAIFSGEVLGFSQGESIVLILMANITSALGAFFFGFVQDKIGAKQTLFITLGLWLVAVLGAFAVHSKLLFWLVANIVGFAMGASQSASRSLVGLLAPEEKAAEFYGFWGFASKAAAITGLFSFGLLYRITGGMRPAILVTALFFLGGIWLLRGVDDGHRTGRDEFKDILG